MRGGSVLFVATAILLVGGAGRLVYIEHEYGESLRQKGVRQQTATIPIPALRGELLDTRGRVLAGTVRRPSVYADPSLIADPRFAAHSVAPILDLDPAVLERMLIERRAQQFVWVKREISDAELEGLQTTRRTRRLRGFGITFEPRRVYPHGRLASHVLGFVGAEQHGLGGVELKYEEVLRGIDGSRKAAVDVRRRPIRQQADDYRPPQDGASVVLTIDAHIQERAETHLRGAVEECEAEWGIAIVMDPHSGEVLAMATTPDFDPARPLEPGLDGPALEAATERLRNRAVCDAFEPGSMFKPLIAAAAIDEGRATLDESFPINGPAHNFGGRTINDTHAYDRLTLEEVISKSSNIGMGMLGQRCGNAALYAYVRRYGLGEPTGIGLPGESAGLVQPLAQWTNYSTQSIAIGQEIAVTPIQMAAAFSVFCNGGLLYRPKIVRGIIGPAGETLADFAEPEFVREVLAADVAEEFRMRALVRVVTSGSGRGRERAELADYQVFGKTGTAQVARPDGRGYLPDTYVGSFVGGAPASDPRVIVLVSIYIDGKKLYYGGQVAAPAVRDILADTLAYLRVPPEHRTEPVGAHDAGH